MRVLVVDDDLATIELMRLTLDSFGYSAVSATNVADALAMVAKQPPQVVLSDLTFTDSGSDDENGCTLARSVRAIPACADVAMIAITGITSPLQWKAALDSGFNEVMMKPFDIEVLIERIAALAGTGAPSSVS